MVHILAAQHDARVRADGGELSSGARRPLVELQVAADHAELAPKAAAPPDTATGSGPPAGHLVEVAAMRHYAETHELRRAAIPAQDADGIMPRARVY